MPARLAQNGLVILSGLLLEQVEPLLAVYRDAGFTLNERADEGDWGAVCLRRIPGP
jgi:ribosomal protein L11 methyltransferase